MQVSNCYPNINFGKKYCYIPKCKAICCASAPIPKDTFDLFQLLGKAARKTIITYDAPLNNRYCKGAVIPLTTPKALKYRGKTRDGRNMWQVNLYAEDNYCSFLDKNYKCNIYENRPPVCRNFGTEYGRSCPAQVTKAELYKLKTRKIVISTLKKAASLFV